MIFLILIVLNLVAGFQALGTLMSVGLMMLSAAAARFWARDVWSLALTSSFIGFLSSLFGLLLSFHGGLPSGPAIVLTAGVCYTASVIAGPHGSLRTRYLARSHLRA
jgi:zinc/manganese transport system permease protein